METEYTLTYFDARGWAEPARQILSYAGAKWKDNRLPFLGPGKSVIPDDVKSRTRFGQVPLLEFGDKKLVQSVTIYRYLGHQFNLAGKDSFESAQCDEIVDAGKDIINLFMPHFHKQDEAEKLAGFKEAGAAAKARFLSKFNEIIEENGGHLVGNSLTWADIVIVCFLEMMRGLGNGDLIDDFPAILGLMKTVTNAKGIKEWLATRPVTPM
jgi:glutathione S-transferase